MVEHPAINWRNLVDGLLVVIGGIVFKYNYDTGTHKFPSEQIKAKYIFFLPRLYFCITSPKGIKKSWFFGDTYLRCLTLKYLPSLKWW